ncbi:MAG: hypothetical protein WD448_05095 [Woeseia sp.]
MTRQLSLVTFVAFILAAGDSAAERTAARIGSGEEALPALIEFPELKGDTTAVIRCAARIQKNGRMKDNGCAASSPADQIFAVPVTKAARKARLLPAVADDREREIYFQYRVEFIKKGDDETINVYPNPGVQENIDAYGPGHVAAQREIGTEQWQKECPARTRYLVWLKGHVAADGTRSNLSLTHGSGLNPTPRCQQAILDSVGASFFFPALADGEPVPSTYVEPFGN